MTNRLVLICILLLAASGCESSHANLEEKLANANRQIEILQQGFLRDQLNECRARSAQDRQNSFVAGKYAVLNSIEVAGVPRKVSGIFFDDYYYRFEVRVNGRRYAFVEVQTTRQETPVGSLLAKIGDLAKVMAGAN